MSPEIICARCKRNPVQTKGRRTAAPTLICDACRESLKFVVHQRILEMVNTRKLSPENVDSLRDWLESQNFSNFTWKEAVRASHTEAFDFLEAQLISFWGQGYITADQVSSHQHLCRSLLTDPADAASFQHGLESMFSETGQALPMDDQAEEQTPNSQSRSTKSSHSRKMISDEVKIFVWRRDEGRCVKCGRAEDLEYDHIIPLAKGGSNTARNLQLLCEHCNRKKGRNIV
jgi:HNH endonuclease